MPGPGQRSQAGGGDLAAAGSRQDRGISVFVLDFDEQ